ncbi:phospholipid-binding protein [Oscillatoria sp. FACHB-1407]|uniref:BON domain-containing protein n=1 Tax=Oscillatoria sp. FACHB-1407 TaxID=2692847 RepID=UPI001682C765|nr:BON domain-containing protein [Oscillatoria sp. FACHB-1407]MBD2460916.1 phospholipid-binding protein [Oscillatoria sp. FACHB-1407]
MSWLQRLFGVKKPQGGQQPATASRGTATAAPSNAGQSVPPERMGLNGEYDESGLAKRVALAFDEDSTVDDIDTLYVAQTGSTVVLKGKVPNRELLNKMVSIARGVNGATAVDTAQVEVA